MTLIVENGTQVANANSYLALADVVNYCTSRGLDFPSDPVIGEQQIMRAMDYLENLGPRYYGAQVSPLTQALEWPRQRVPIATEQTVSLDYGVEYVNTLYLDITVIPPRLKNALCILASITGTVNLTPVVDSMATIRKTIGPLTTEFSQTLGTSLSPLMPGVDAMLAPLLQPAYGLLRNTRV